MSAPVPDEGPGHARSMSASIALIAAVAENGVIGARGGLPWRVKGDFRRFRAITMGKPLIMGRKTFKSIGRPLDGRDNIVLTRAPSAAIHGALVAASLEEALALAADRAAARGVDEIFVIGGGELFREVLPLAERLYITHIQTAPAGDVHFPGIPPQDWAEITRDPIPPSEGDTARAVHAVYERRR